MFTSFQPNMKTLHVTVEHVTRYHEWYMRFVLRVALLTFLGACMFASVASNWTWYESWAVFFSGTLVMTAYRLRTQWMRWFTSMAHYYNMQGCRSDWSLHRCKDTQGPHAHAVRLRADMLRQKARELHAAVSMY